MRTAGRILRRWVVNLTGTLLCIAAVAGLSWGLYSAFSAAFRLWGADIVLILVVVTFTAIFTLVLAISKEFD